VVGSAVLGVVAALALQGTLDAGWGTVLGAGFAGGLTTFSTFSLDVVELWRQHRTLRAVLDVAAHLVLGVGAAVAGFHLVA
jgi:CrcB protein